MNTSHSQVDIPTRTTVIKVSQSDNGKWGFACDGAMYSGYATEQECREAVGDWAMKSYIKRYRIE